MNQDFRIQHDRSRQTISIQRDTVLLPRKNELGHDRILAYMKQDFLIYHNMGDTMINIQPDTMLLY